MTERVYRVEDTLTIVGVGYVRAHSKEEAVARAGLGQVEFDYDDGANLRRGDGLRAYVVRDPEKARFFDPGEDLR